jgi:hypothetical protein
VCVCAEQGGFGGQPSFQKTDGHVLSNRGVAPGSCDDGIGGGDMCLRGFLQCG